MRIWLWGLVLVMGCGRQLNPDYCTDHQSDSDCAAAGYINADAAAPCMTDAECTQPGKNVCDVVARTCVACTPTDHPACIDETKVCSTSDVCVQCVQDSDCAASGICLVSSATCATPDSILHAAPDGGATAPCTTAMKCSLDHAIAIADAAHHVIQLDDGQYTIADTMTLALEGLHLVPTTGAAPKITVPNKTTFAVTASAEIDSMEIIGSTSTIIKCNGGNNQPILVLEQVNVHGSNTDGIDVDQCTLTLERSKVYSNKQSAVYAQNSSVAIRNSFFFANGNTTYDNAAVTFAGATDGKMEFCTLSFNTGYDQQVFNPFHGRFEEVQHASAVSCHQQPSSSKTVDLNGNLFVSDQPYPYEITTLFGSASCTGDFTKDNLVASTADAMFVSTSDQHLTSATPTGTGKVRDDPSSNCSNVGQDVDGDTRPLGGACDYGADEFKTP